MPGYDPAVSETSNRGPLAGLRVLDVSGGFGTKSKFYGAASRNILALCERPAL